MRSTKEKPDLQKKVHNVPHKPGVYLMRDRFNRVIYVGKARDLRKRVSSYFLPSKIAQADLKTRAMLDAVWDFETHIVRSDADGPEGGFFYALIHAEAFGHLRVHVVLLEKLGLQSLDEIFAGAGGIVEVDRQHRRDLVGR